MKDGHEDVCQQHRMEYRLIDETQLHLELISFDLRSTHDPVVIER